MVCWTGRRQVVHGKAQSQTRENYDCGYAGRWFRSVKFKRLDSFLFHGLGFWLGLAGPVQVQSRGSAPPGGRAAFLAVS